MELKNCLKVASDIRTEMGAHVLSLEDKLRQTQVETPFLMESNLCFQSELSLYVGRLQQDVKELLNFKNDTAQSVKIRFDHWIKDEYKSDEFKAVVGKKSLLYVCDDFHFQRSRLIEKQRKDRSLTHWALLDLLPSWRMWKH